MGFARRSGGFTLIEMMVATIILFIGVVAALACIGQATNSTGVASEYTQAATLAQRRFGEIDAQINQLSAGEQQGQYDDATPPMRWRQNVEGTSLQNLYRIDLVLEWPGGINGRTATFSTYVIKPPEQQQQQQ